MTQITQTECLVPVLNTMVKLKPLRQDLFTIVCAVGNNPIQQTLVIHKLLWSQKFHQALHPKTLEW